MYDTSVRTLTPSDVSCSWQWRQVRRRQVHTCRVCCDTNVTAHTQKTFWNEPFCVTPLHVTGENPSSTVRDHRYCQLWSLCHEPLQQLRAGVCQVAAVGRVEGIKVTQSPTHNDVVREKTWQQHTTLTQTRTGVLTHVHHVTLTDTYTYVCVKTLTWHWLTHACASVLHTNTCTYQNVKHVNLPIHHHLQSWCLSQETFQCPLAGVCQVVTVNPVETETKVQPSTTALTHVHHMKLTITLMYVTVDGTNSVGDLFNGKSRQQRAQFHLELGICKHDTCENTTRHRIKASQECHVGVWNPLPAATSSSHGWPAQQRLAVPLFQHKPP